MGTRVEVSIPTPSLRLTGNTVADNYVNALRPLQGSIDSLSSLGSLTQNTLTATKSALDVATISPMKSTENLISVHTSSLNNNLGIAIRTSPPRAIQQLSSLPNNISRISTSATSAFNAAKEAVTSTNSIIALALMAVCLAVASTIQGAISKLSAAILRLQRTILAKIDAIKKQAIELVQAALSAAMEILPDCPQEIKDVIQELRSILGKASTIVAAINNILREVAACAAIGATVASVLTGKGSIWSITSKSRDLIKFDIANMKKEYRDGIQSSKLEIENNRDWYLNNNYLWDSTVGKLVEAKKDAEDSKNILEDLIEDSKEHGDSQEYQDALENAKKDLEDLIGDLEDAENGLYDETLNTLDKMTDDALSSLDDLQQNLEGETDTIGDSIDGIFEGLESIAKEFDSPEVQESLATACAENEFRTVLEDNS